MANRVPDPELLSRLKLSASGVEWAAGLVTPWQHEPFEEGWTPHQQVFHLLGTETHVFQPRLARILAQERPAFDNWDEPAHLAREHNRDQDIVELAAAFMVERAATIAIMEGLAEDAWERRGLWPDGREVDVAWIAGQALWHGLDHLATLLDAYQEFSPLHARA